MAHRIYMQNGKASIMYYGEKPWHGLGQEVGAPATAEMALQAALLDYDVVKQPLYACTGSLTHTLGNKFALIRQDLMNQKGCPVYGVVGKSYKPLQNRDAFKFFDPIVGKGAAIYHTAGALGRGERVWILAKLPGEIRVADNDVVDKFLLLSNCHDGKTSIQIKFTPIRVVCNNTLTLALKEGAGIRIYHTSDGFQKLANANEALGIIEQGFNEIDAAYGRLARVRMTGDRPREYFKLVFPDPKDPKTKKALDIARRHREWAEHFFLAGKGNSDKAVAGSLWAAYNGVTEYIDHRKHFPSLEQHLQSVWFGSGYRVKARAFEIATERCRGWAS